MVITGEQQCYASGGCAEIEKTMKGFGLRMHSAYQQETCKGDLKISLSRKQSEKTSWERHQRGFSTLNAPPDHDRLLE